MRRQPSCFRKLFSGFMAECGFFKDSISMIGNSFYIAPDKNMGRSALGHQYSAKQRTQVSNLCPLFWHFYILAKIRCSFAGVLLLHQNTCYIEGVLEHLACAPDRIGAGGQRELSGHNTLYIPDQLSLPVH